MATPRPDPWPVQVIGGDGVAVTFTKPPERIVAIDSAAVEILFALGQERRLAATHSFVDYPPASASIPRVGNAFDLNLEQIAGLDADLVFIFFDRFVPQLRGLQIPVLYLESPATFGQAAEHMRMWGRITGNAAAGEELATDFEASLSDIKARASGAGPVKVFQDVAPGLWTLGEGSLADEVFKLLGAENTFADVSGARQVSAEEIVARGPEVIISVHPGGAAAWSGEPAFAAVPAVRNGRVCEVDGAKLSVAGTRLVDGIIEVAKCLYPDRF